MGQGTVLCPVADMSSAAPCDCRFRHAGQSGTWNRPLSRTLLPGVQVLDGAGCLRQTKAAVVISEAQARVVAGGADGGQTPPVHPGHFRPVVPYRGVADGVIGDGVAVVGRQQVRPLGKTGTVTSL